MTTTLTPTSIITRPVVANDSAAISALQARVFGPGRFARSAYRVREASAGQAGSPSMSRFCRVADRNGRLIASLRLTKIEIGGTPNAYLLGPLSVDPDFRGQGYGRKLLAEAVDEMTMEGVALIILVGDEPYYSRFGFKPVTPGTILFPGPVNPARILAAELKTGSLANYRGMITAVAG